MGWKTSTLLCQSYLTFEIFVRKIYKLTIFHQKECAQGLFGQNGQCNKAMQIIHSFKGPGG